MTKEEFNEKMRQRTKKLAVDVINFVTNLPPHKAMRVVEYQLTKAITSVAANYRASCRARSQAEFHSKISIVVEEADESLFWLEIIEDLNIDKSPQIKYLQNEALEILKICSKARSNS
ncbi:MAG: four helix bundle protein [Phycisphaerae bacterium]|nr:four helix bundle protein [Saprospiraceae bacterium]